VSGEHLDAGELFERHAPFVARFLVRLGARAAEVDDLVQEVFLTAHRRGGFVEGAARPTTWLAEIAVRVLSTHRRTQRRHPEQPDQELAAVASGDAGPAERAAAGQLLERLNLALSSLDIDKRAVFVLFELDGESCDAIAAGLGVPLTTAYSRLHSARKELKAAFARLMKEPAGG
jgi:RNA polymerase sigma-70 factor (ECF subfamily)